MRGDRVEGQLELFGRLVVHLCDSLLPLRGAGEIYLQRQIFSDRLCVERLEQHRGFELWENLRDEPRLESRQENQRHGELLGWTRTGDRSLWPHDQREQYLSATMG